MRDAAADGLCQGRLAAVVDVQDAAVGREGAELLLVVGHSGWQGCEMPVQVRVALLAAQAQRVHPLGGHRRGQCLGHLVHDVLEGEELVLVQVVHPVLDVPLGRHQAVAQQDRPAGQERDGAGVFVDIVVGIVRMPGQDRADKARPFAGPAHVGPGVEGHPGGRGAVHRCIIAA